MSRAYLDHASTSPLRPQARRAVIDALERLGGDPGRIHEEGLTARVALEQAREQVAVLLGARAREVVFTSGATESIVTAVWGSSARTRERAGSPVATVHHVVTAVEHSAVRHTADRAGDVTVVPVDAGGRVDVDAVLAAIRPDTAAVHVQWGNHEVGTVQPVAEVAAGCRERKVLIHVDAAQAAGRVPIAFDALGADLMSISGHKLGGPAGTGALLVRRGLRIPPLLLGGDQERARRAGLEPVAQLVGFGAACAALLDPAHPVDPADHGGGQDDPGNPAEHGSDPVNPVNRVKLGASRQSDGSDGSGHGGASGGSGERSVAPELGRSRWDIESRESRRLTDRIRALLAGIDGVVSYGDPDHRLPHLVCVGVDGVEPQGVLLGLDRAGIAAHSGSACSSESLEPSPVLEAMGVDAHHSLRLSVGWTTTDADVDRLEAALPQVIADLRALAR